MSATVLAAVDNWLGLGLGVVLLAYLFVALLWPDRF
ncbi:MAG: K(+)-transporting ATPase subunit F [Actinomycetota bacterium]